MIFFGYIFFLIGCSFQSKSIGIKAFSIKVYFLRCFKIVSKFFERWIKLAYYGIILN